LDWTNKRSFTVDGFSPERFLVSAFTASEKFDPDLELDAGMHKSDAHPKPMGMGVGTQYRALNKTRIRDIR
jgi:hypothetical protein